MFKRHASRHCRLPPVQQYNCWTNLHLFNPQLHCGLGIKATMTNSYRVLSSQHYAYFVTWTVVDWLYLFDKVPYRQIILDSLEYLRTHKHTQVNAFVVMSTHVHAVLWPEIGINLSDVARDFKRFTSRQISREAIRQNASEILSVFEKARNENRAQDTSTYQVWQEGSHPEAIFTEKFAKQKIDYIHQNPVTAGLAATADQWPYSSARAYLLGKETYPHTDLLITG
ncbi:MAG: transposase [Chloroflexi bacterium]|nr:transposase [Chloroflexota bacterium]